MIWLAGACGKGSDGADRFIITLLVFRKLLSDGKALLNLRLSFHSSALRSRRLSRGTTE
jgi:hypothetical protein